jgi:alpha-L-fucosidase
MNRCLLGILILLSAGLTATERDTRMAWWRDARFGMFIHWGIYALPAGEYKGIRSKEVGEWIMSWANIPRAEYERFAPRFNPVKFDAARWVAIARDAGMKYIVITSKHHDGFSMFDSAVTTYDVVDATPYKKDPMRALADEARRQGLKFAFYYSIMDWHHPSQYVDVPGKHADAGHGQTKMRDGRKREYVGKGRRGMEGLSKTDRDYAGDFGTPEQQIPASGLPGVDWESCMTMNETWGFKSDDHNWKSAETLVRNLVDSASKGGNYLLNVGPTAEGEIPAPSVERLAAVGRWMKVNGESIYGSTASPFSTELPWGRVTSKPDRIYLHVFDWPANGTIALPRFDRTVTSAVLIGTKHTARVTTSASGVEVGLPPTTGTMVPVVSLR